jgi:hypothetical protein
LLDRLRSLLQDSDYLVEETYEESESRLRDSMTFEATLVGWKYVDRFSLIRVITGYLLIPILVGLLVLFRAKVKEAFKVQIEIRGEAYRAAAKSTEAEHEPVSERIGTASDARGTLTARVAVLTVPFWVTLLTIGLRYLRREPLLLDSHRSRLWNAQKEVDKLAQLISLHLSSMTEISLPVSGEPTQGA